MNRNTPKQTIQHLLQSIDVKINGNNPWDIHVKNENLYSRIIKQGALGFGEAYMDNWWECQQLDVLFTKIIQAKIEKKVSIPISFKLKQIIAKIINLQSKIRANVVAKKHYDLGNDLFAAMLDKNLVYSCGYWKDAQSLEEAQQAKLELICQKLKLSPGMRILDIGCGWGGLAKHMAEKHGAQVVGITISQQQYEYAKINCRHLPVEILLQDYRDINTKFDRVVSVGMFEHVGHLNYKKFMHIVYKALAEDGLFLLHTIGVNKPNPLANEWISTYIFPNGCLPSPTKIFEITDDLFILEDWHNFGSYYDNTLISWYHNFVNNWDKLKHKYDERFFRMWTYYLLTCAASFRARTNQLWQIVFSKNGVRGGYQAPR